jgi:hypothetical protein
VRNVDFGNFSVAALAGDYNRDGTVDGSDYIVWRRTLGSHVSNFSGADGDGNGIVEQADFNVWRLHFGQTSTGGGSGSGLSDLAAGSGAETQSEPLTAPVLAEATSTSLSTDQAPLSAEVASNAGVVTSSESAKSVAGSMQVYEIVGVSSVTEHDAIVIELPSESTSSSDLGLLAWLAASPVGERPQTDATSWTDKDLSDSFATDEQDTLDIAFELLEGNALLSAAI